jgi:hypothetical protein
VRESGEREKVGGESKKWREREARRVLVLPPKGLAHLKDSNKGSGEGGMTVRWVQRRRAENGRELRGEREERQETRVGKLERQVGYLEGSGVGLIINLLDLQNL